MLRHQRFPLLLLLTILICTPSLAIETGEIQGRVVDDRGESLPGVEISASGPSLQGSRTILALKSGDFRFPLLPTGIYTLTFKLDGFSTLVQEKVVVHLGKVTVLAAPMKISEIN